MAVKKAATSKSASPKAAKKVVAKKAATPKTKATAKPPVATVTSTKVGTPKAAMPASPGVKKAASKEAAPIKLTDRQRDFLKTISERKEQGYTALKKAEQKTIEALLDRKLIKRGSKDKKSGSYCYLVSKAGEKHLASSGTQA
jgi:hypothetical protein